MRTPTLVVAHPPRCASLLLLVSIASAAASSSSACTSCVSGAFVVSRRGSILARLCRVGGVAAVSSTGDTGGLVGLRSTPRQPQGPVSTPVGRTAAVGMASRASARDGSAEASENAEEEKKKFPPCRSVVDPSTNDKWRRCAAAAVLDASSAPPRLLIGERLGMPGSWQCPQGGVDDVDPDAEEGDARKERGETVPEAAARELYEEMGLEVGRDVDLSEEWSGGAGSDSEGDDDIGGVAPVRYETTGTGSWLERAGFAGQELRWAIFRCVSDSLRDDPRAT